MKTKFLLLLVLPLFLASCDDDNDTMDPPAATSGDISGGVNLYDSGGTQVDNSGMLVTVMGTNPLITSTTDLDGRYTLEDVPFGTYVIMYEKTDYGTFKRFDVDLNAGNYPLQFSQINSLGQMTSNTVNTLSVNVLGDTVFVETNTPGGSVANDIYYRSIFSNVMGVSLSQLEGYTPTYISRNSTGNLKISKDELEDFGFTSGQTVYVKSVAESFFSNDYYDPDKAMHVFPNANETGSTELSFTMP